MIIVKVCIIMILIRNKLGKKYIFKILNYLIEYVVIDYVNLCMYS